MEDLLPGRYVTPTPPVPQELSEESFLSLGWAGLGWRVWSRQRKGGTLLLRQGKVCACLRGCRDRSAWCPVLALRLCTLPRAGQPALDSAGAEHVIVRQSLQGICIMAHIRQTSHPARRNPATVQWQRAGGISLGSCGERITICAPGSGKGQVFSRRGPLVAGQVHWGGGSSL